MRSYKKTICLTVFALIISFGTNAQAQENTFKAAVIKKDITPEVSKNLRGYGARKSTGVNTSIYHRILALDDGRTEYFLISTDLVGISPSEYDRVMANLNKQHGIDRDNVLWTFTHTHSAPEVGPPGLSILFMPERFEHPVDTSYTKFVEQTLIDGILEARNNLEPAMLGIGSGFSQANINRRAIDVDGRASLGMNPDGSVDRKIGLLRIDKENGDPLALVANYPIHGTVLGEENLKIDGDAPGIVSEYVEEKIGAPLLFINGAAGNIAPIYSVYPDPQSGHLEQFKVLLGDRILEANNRISTSKNEVRLNTGKLTVETPRKEGLGWPSELDDYNRTTSSGVHLVRLPVRFLKINDELAIWSAPLELFNEISSEVRDRSPFPYTFYFGYANGSLGYLVTESAYDHGGYEPNVSPFTPSAASDLVEAVVSFLHGEMKSN